MSFDIRETSEKTIIRRAENKDSSRIARYYRNIWLDMGLVIKNDSESILNCLSQAIKKDVGRLNKNHIIVCESDGEIAGAVFAYDGDKGQRYTDDLLEFMEDFGLDTSQLVMVCESKPDEYYIDALYIDKTYRGNGLGTALLEHCCDIAKEKHSVAVLNVDPENKKAHKLYKKMGFSFTEDRYLGEDKYIAMGFLN